MHQISSSLAQGQPLLIVRENMSPTQNMLELEPALSGGKERGITGSKDLPEGYCFSRLPS